jgi:hypothetical protein
MVSTFAEWGHSRNDVLAITRDASGSLSNHPLGLPKLDGLLERIGSCTDPVSVG